MLTWPVRRDFCLDNMTETSDNPAASQGRVLSAEWNLLNFFKSSVLLHPVYNLHPVPLTQDKKHTHTQMH